MKKAIFLLPAALLLLGLSAAPGAARERTTFRARSAKIAQGLVFGDKALMNINNFSLWFKRDGDSALNPYNSNAGATFPRSTSQVIFEDGLVWGGKVMDGNPQVLRVGGSTYHQGCVPGRIVSKGVADNRDDPKVRIYRVRRDYQTADLRRETAEYLNKGPSEVSSGEVEALRAQYAKDWREWPAAWGAPYYDKNGNGQYDPDTDEPGVANADQVAWFAINDLDVGAVQALYGSLPIGLECQVLMWGYARTDALGDAIFKKFTVIYKGTADTPADARIDSMYFAQWSDPDLGDAGDDFAGCDTELSLGYVYNGRDRDDKYQAFNLAPPAAGYDFLQGPVVPDGNAEAIFNFQKRKGYKNLPMTSFVYFAAGSSINDPEFDYTGTQAWYNMLRGYQPQPDVDNPTPFTNPLTGEETKFALDGDPTRGTGWNDGVPLPPGDRRIVLDTGPFSMALGDTQEVVVALLGGSSSHRLRSVSKLKYTDKFVQEAYDKFFNVSPPPTAPKVRVDEEDKAITLDWGFDPDAVRATEENIAPPFHFEGYNIYQFPLQDVDVSQAKRIATFDLANGITNILSLQLDEESGAQVMLPTRIGADSGLRWNLTITRDAIRGGPLVNGQRYYYAVTAYSYNPDPEAVVNTLESIVASKIEAVPQVPPPGTRQTQKLDDLLEVRHTRGGGVATVEAAVVAPAELRDATYVVGFNQNQTWKLSYNGAVVLDDQSNYSLDDSGYVAVNGVLVKVGRLSFSAPSEFLSAEVTNDANPGDGNLAFWGDCAGFGLPNCWASNFWGEGGTDSTALLTRDLELRFTGVWNGDQTEIVSGGSMATLASVSKGGGTRTLDGHPYRPAGAPATGPFLQRIPFEVWDVEDPAHPRQLNVAFSDRGADGSREADVYHKTYNMAGRDYITIIASDYDATAIHDLTDPKATWVLFFEQGGSSVWSTGDVLRIKYANSIVPGEDEFQFVTQAPKSSSEWAREDVGLINVFPNPYYGVNEAETSPYQHFVTFSHLPQKAVIRIYDLSGTLVRKLDKDDAEQFLRWDLNNQDELPVASGLYIAHVELPDLKKSRILRLAIVQEQQFLENF